MVHVVAVGHRAVTSPEFSLKDVPGTGGRLDVLLRVVNATFVLSHGLRRDASLTLLLLGPPNPPRAVKLSGADLKHLNPDERTTATLVQKALAVPTTAHVWQPSTPGIAVAERAFTSVLDDALAASPGGRLVVLDEEGDDVRDVGVGPDDVVVVGDHEGFTDVEAAELDRRGATRVHIGPRSLHADHAVVVLLNELDRAAPATGEPGTRSTTAPRG